MNVYIYPHVVFILGENILKTQYSLLNLKFFGPSCPPLISPFPLGCRVIPLVGTAAEHQFQSPATLEDVVDAQGFHNCYVEAVVPAAIAAVRLHMDQNDPRRRPGGWDAETGRWGMGALEALYGLLQCSEGMVQEDIQVP